MARIKIRKGRSWITGGLILLLLLCLFNFPSSVRKNLRSMLLPLGEVVSYAKEEPSITDRLCAQLQTENYLLQEKISLLEENNTSELHSITARVVYRDPTAWSSFVWIDQGDLANIRRGKRIIEVGSPVVEGKALVGVVEEVEEERSLVRLITDSQLVPSVRVKREEDKTLYLAKGELRGSSSPLWRKNNLVLQGRGFNYDFSDEEGDGQGMHCKNTLPLIQVGDLLVTTGMDAFFPRDLDVARVSKIFPLKEGAYFFQLEADPVAPNLHDLFHVAVLPKKAFIR